MNRISLCLAWIASWTVLCFAAQNPESGAANTCIRGTIVSTTGRGRMEGSVTLESRGFASTCKTPPSGYFMFCGIRPGTYVLEASSPGFAPVRTEVASGSGETLTIALQPERGDVPPAAPTRATVDIRSLRVPRQAREELDLSLREAAARNWEKSLLSLRKAVEIYPEYVDAWVNMGVVYTQLGDFAPAETAFRLALEIEPGDAVIRRKLGYLYLSQRKWDDALRELERSEDLNRADPLTQAYLGYVLNGMEKPALALGHLTKALKREPDLPVALFAMGFVQLRLNDTAKALQFLQRFLEVNPQAPSAREVRELVARLQH